MFCAQEDLLATVFVSSESFLLASLRVVLYFDRCAVEKLMICGAETPEQAQQASKVMGALASKLPCGSMSTGTKSQKKDCTRARSEKTLQQLSDKFNPCDMTPTAAKSFVATPVLSFLASEPLHDWVRGQFILHQLNHAPPAPLCGSRLIKSFHDVATPKLLALIASLSHFVHLSEVPKPNSSTWQYVGFRV